MDIVEIHDRDGLQMLQSEWSRLVEGCSHATIYQTWEWNDAWWRTFGAQKRLRILVARDGPRVVGIAPLYVSRHYNTPLRRLAFLGTGVSDYLDVLAEAGMEDRVARAFLEYLAGAPGFELADLQQVSPLGLLYRCACTVAEPRLGRRTISLVDMEPCPYVALPPTWDEYLSQLGRKMRSNIGYYPRLLYRSFASVDHFLAEGDQLESALEDLFHLHQSRWNARLLPGVLGGNRVRQFHRLVAARFAARGWLRLHVLRVDGAAIAALYCFRYRHRYYYYLGGFAPEAARFSPGTILTAEAIRTAVGEGCTEFDFLRGHEPYKYRWTSTHRMNRRVLLCQPGSAWSRALLTINKIERSVERRAKALAETRGRRRQA